MRGVYGQGEFMYLKILEFLDIWVNSIALPEFKAITDDHYALYRHTLPSAFLCLLCPLFEILYFQRLSELLLHGLREVIFFELIFF